MGGKRTREQKERQTKNLIGLTIQVILTDFVLKPAFSLKLFEEDREYFKRRKIRLRRLKKIK